MPDTDAHRDYGFATFLSRHFVSLATTYVALDPDGKEVGEAACMAYSGFVISVSDMWFFVTAGHVLQDELDRNLEGKKIKLLRSSWVDYLGPNAKVFEPTPFDYQDQARFYIDDSKAGLDFGLIPLRPLYRDGMEANGVVPISEENWIHQHKLDFELYKMLGLNPKLAASRATRGHDYVKVESSIQTVLVNVDKLETLPEDVRAPTNPWFMGKIGNAEALPSIKGMSGGPIYGFRRENGRWEYHAVALQSWWFPERRIVFGCSVPAFARMVVYEMAKARAAHGAFADE